MILSSLDFLSQDCVDVNGDDTKHLSIDLQGTVIYSHRHYASRLGNSAVSGTGPSRRQSKSKQFNVDATEEGVPVIADTNSASSMLHDNSSRQASESLSMDAYPINFSCKIFVQAAMADSQIMIRFRSLYIPSKHAICDDNYLYVFESNTPHYRAMVGWTK